MSMLHHCSGLLLEQICKAMQTGNGDSLSTIFGNNAISNTSVSHCRLQIFIDKPPARLVHDARIEHAAALQTGSPLGRITPTNAPGHPHAERLIRQAALTCLCLQGASGGGADV